MKARQMQAQFEAQKMPVRRHATVRKMFAGLAAAAAVLVCGTVTVGAVNNWDYIGLFNRYFRTQNADHKDFDFSGMGLDINETFQCDGYSIDIQSVVAEANALHLIYSFRLDPEYEAQLPQNGEPIYGNVLPSVRLLDAEGNYVDIGSASSRDAEQNPDGSFDCMTTLGLNYCDDLTDKTLQLDISSEARAGAKSYLNLESETGGVTTPFQKMRNLHTYSLAGIRYLQGVNVSDITLTDGEYTAAYDSMTLSPLRISFTRSDVEIVPVESDEPGVTVGSGCYGWCCSPDEAADGDSEHAPIPPAYADTALRSVTLIYRDGTEQDVSWDFAEGTGRTKMNPETFHYDLMDIDFSADFNEPVSIENLTAIRINGIEFTL